MVSRYRERIRPSTDAGFDVAVFVEMIGLLSRYSDVDLDLGDANAADVRAFFSDWSAEFEPGW